ncbi:MAG: type II secretion system F family protein [Syntrophobacteraceae bacterium]|nr:type II secretion system F family protein [Syntrophobacteraceae bacterium]
MAKFAYQAINESGTTVSGVIEADSRGIAEDLLAKRGFIPSRLVRENGARSLSLGERLQELLSQVKAQELILFTKQFRTLLKAGVPILNALQVLESQSQNIRLKRAAAAMSLDIREGANLHDAFRKHPAVFSPLYCSMIHTGESSGALPEVLDRLTYIIEHEHKIRSDIRAALQYPVTVVAALGIAFFILLNFVVPKFAAIFKSAGLDLPLPTRLCIELHHFLAAYWIVLLVLCIIAFIALKWYLGTPEGRLLLDRSILRLPIMGPLFLKAAMSRFASIFAILQSSGVPVLDTLRILSATIQNQAIGGEFERIRERVEEGHGISSPLRNARFFTPMTVNMIAIGEESGKLDEMLHEISIHYDDEVAYAVRGLSEALGPLLIVGLAGVVGFFALAIFLPMWDLAQMTQRGM